MSLYLIGRSNGNDLVFASDGRSFDIDTRAGKRIESDEVNKIQAIMSNIVVCHAGSSDHRQVIESLLTMACSFLDRTYPNRATAVEIYKLFNPNDWVMREIEKAFEGMTANFISTGRDPTFYGSSHDLVSKSGNSVMCAKITCSHKQPYIRVNRRDETMRFPYRTGGVPSLVNEMILELALHDRLLQSKDNLKGMFVFFLNTAESELDEVGGRHFLGELTARGYRQLTERDEIDADAKASEFKAMYSQLGHVVDPERIKASASILREAVASLDDPPLLNRAAEKRVRLSISTNRTDYLLSAIALLEVNSTFERDDVITDHRVLLFSNFLLGELYLQVGRERDAERVFNCIYEAKISDPPSVKEVNIVLSALKRLTEIDKAKYSERLVNALRTFSYLGWLREDQ